MREAPEPCARIGKAHSLKQADGLPPGPRDLLDLTSDPHGRIKRCHRILKYRPQLSPTDAPPVSGRSGQHVRPAHNDLSAHERGRLGRQESQQGEPEHCLARARLTDQAHDLASGNRETDPAQCMHGARAAAELDHQVLEPGHARWRLVGAQPVP